MKVQIHSDLHLEFSSITIKPEASVLILAGDIMTKGVDDSILREWWEYVSNNWETVIYVLGNHEFYHSKMTMDKIREWVDELVGKYGNIYVLDKEDLYIHDQDTEIEWRVMGVPMFPVLTDIEGLNCVNRIKLKNDKGYTKGITMEKWNEMSRNDSEWFIQNYEKDIHTILVTHYPVTRVGVTSGEYDKDDITEKSKYCQELGLTRNGSGSVICISGHTHYSHDFTRNGIRYISNARGYPGESIGYSTDGIFELTHTM